jgi:hypothetical protein
MPPLPYCLLKGKSLLQRLWSVTVILSGILLWRAVASDYRDRTKSGEIPPGVITSDHLTLLTFSGVVGLYGMATLLMGKLWW